MGEPTPEGPDQPPGARNWVRILIETQRAHREALAAGHNLTDELTPRRWSGGASSAFVDIGVPKVGNEWRAIAEIHGQATERVTGYHTFLEELPKLWPGWENPAECSRLSVLYQQATGQVAVDLLAWAAQLDQAGHVEFADPETVSSPAIPAGSPWPRENVDPPSPHLTDSDPMPPEPTDSEPDHAEPEHSDQNDADQRESTDLSGVRPAVAMFGRSHETAYRLREQMVTGERRDHIPWTG